MHVKNHEVCLLKRASKALISLYILLKFLLWYRWTVSDPGSTFPLTFQFNFSVVCIRSVSLYIYLLVILVNIHEDFFA